MCLATPCKVVEVKDDQATVQNEEHTHQVNLSLLKDVKVGDYILVHADMAINKLEKKEAEKILKIIKNNHEYK